MSQPHSEESPQTFNSLPSVFSLLHVSPYNLSEAGLLWFSKPDILLLAVCSRHILSRACPLLHNQITSLLQNSPPGPAPQRSPLTCLHQRAPTVLASDSGYHFTPTVPALYAEGVDTYASLHPSSSWPSADCTQLKEGRNSSNKTTRPCWTVSPGLITDRIDRRMSSFVCFPH